MKLPLGGSRTWQPAGRRIAPVLLLSGLLGALQPSLAPAQAIPKYDPGASDREITIGNTAPYSGPASALGTLGYAMAAYFEMVNAQGGVNGRKIRFISYDDAYSPPRTVEQVRRLVEHDKVLLLCGTFGTPTNSAIYDYVNRNGIPHLFPVAGASKFNDPAGHPWTVAFTYPSSWAVGWAFADYVSRHHPGVPIGILSQNDDYGRDTVRGFKDRLGPAGQGWIALEQTYEVTDPALDSQVVALKASGATVLVSALIPRSAVQVIRKMAETGWTPVHLTHGPSVSIEGVLKPAGAKAATGLIFGLWPDKDPEDARWADDPGVRGYREWMARYYPRGKLEDSFNVWAYNQAEAVVHVLRRAGDDLTRANILRVATGLRGVQLSMQITGITLNTGPADHAPVEEGYLARFDGTKVERIELIKVPPRARTR